MVAARLADLRRVWRRCIPTHQERKLRIAGFGAVYASASYFLPSSLGIKKDPSKTFSRNPAAPLLAVRCDSGEPQLKEGFLRNYDSTVGQVLDALRSTHEESRPIHLDDPYRSVYGASALRPRKHDNCVVQE